MSQRKTRNESESAELLLLVTSLPQGHGQNAKARLSENVESRSLLQESVWRKKVRGTNIYRRVKREGYSHID